ncbi:uncharacterized protein LOC118644452 [Monomorium pharaonis]|uniref:uncharacterized protein LOC118644452 n=1 Tax=Monomorium pharaonis TaxID=307658 RepID=UPI0017479DAB|nr:uncharacterized protein LOC118644452 [Monomorium pharaonis]
MLYPSIWIGLLILYEPILAERKVILTWNVPHDGLQHYISPVTDQTFRTKRFGFSFLDELRHNICHSFCTSASTMPYFMNLICAIKCPELYLPHGTTTPMPTPGIKINK